MKGNVVVMNYFSIERNNRCWAPVFLIGIDGKIAFKEFLNMSYDEMKSSDKLSDFVVAAMDAANRRSDSADNQTIVTLVGADNTFIWSVIMGPDEDTIRYVLVDWQKDGKKYRYEP